jgi:hypothetical protein
MLLPIFRAPHKPKKSEKEKEKRRYKKLKKQCWKKIKEIILIRRISQNTKELIKNWLRKIKIYKIRKFNSVFSTDEGPIEKENSI